jgi:hypothetical protein
MSGTPRRISGPTKAAPREIRRTAMGVFDSDGTDASGHEQVVFCQDRHSGLKAIIGIN